MTQQASLLASRVGAGRAEGGRRRRSVDPAHTGQVVAEVVLADAGHLRGRLPGGPGGAAGLGRRPRRRCAAR